MLLPICFLLGSCPNQEVANNVAPNWPLYQFSAFAHPVAQLDHAYSGLGLCRPDEFGRPLGVGKIVAVGAMVQTRPQAAALIAYQFGEFAPGLLELTLTVRSYFPFKVNRMHDILSDWPTSSGRKGDTSLLLVVEAARLCYVTVAKDCFWPIADLL